MPILKFAAKHGCLGSSAIQTSNKTCMAHMDIGSSGRQYLIKVTSAVILKEVWPQFNNANIWVVRRKEGGQYGFTAAISADEQKLVVGNPMQRSYVYKRGAHACGSVGEVNPNNVFKAPGWFCPLNRLKRIWQRRLFFSFCNFLIFFLQGNYHHNRKGYEKTLREAKKTEW